MLQDLRHAVRTLLQMKAWTAVVLLSLALGIGANTALFSAVNGLLLRTVPVQDPGTLVRLKWTGENDMVRSSSDYGTNLDYAGQRVRSTFSYAAFGQLRTSNRTLTDIFACAPTGSLNVVVNGEAEIASSLAVSGNYFNVLQVRPLLGRMLTEDDNQAGAPAVAVISHAYWVRRFGSDSSVVGQTVPMNTTPVIIVGVTPLEFTGVQRPVSTSPDVTIPLLLDAPLNNQTRLTEPTYWWLQIMGRLRPGTTLEQVQGNLEGIFQQAARDGFESHLNSLPPEQRSSPRNQGDRLPTLLVQPGSQGVYDADLTSTRSAATLSAVVILVLLIVCANVANLLLSRATARQKEISVRLSMGATRWRLIRQLLTESVMLSSLGGMLGILVAYWSRQLLPFGQTTPLDWRVLAFVASLSVMSGIAFGMVPAFRATRIDLTRSLKENSRSVSRSHTLLSKSLVVLQVAMSIVVLVGAGLFLRTLQNLRNVEIGFNPNNILIFRVNPELNRYEPERIELLYSEIQQSLRGLPGVQSVSLSQSVLLGGSITSSTVHIQGYTGEPPNMNMMTVSPEFFGTMQIALLAGRDFASTDRVNTPRVAVINEAAARQYFPNGNALGGRLGFSSEQNGQIEIVGIIRDTKYARVRDEVPPTMYSSYLQSRRGGMTFLVRTAGDPVLLTEPVRAAVRRIDPNVPVTGVSTQIDQMQGNFRQERFFAMSYSLFGALAVSLASIGLFGLMSYSVVRRTNEIGIRLALGAQRSHVTRMVLGESLLLGAVGIVIGVGGALAAGRFVNALLFGIGATDVITISLVVLLMIAVTTVAGYLPARRASRVDPMIALRYE